MEVVSEEEGTLTWQDGEWKPVSMGMNDQQGSFYLFFFFFKREEVQVCKGKIVSSFRSF